jgi:hypothetical protein
MGFEDDLRRAEELVAAIAHGIAFPPGGMPISRRWLIANNPERLS